MKAVIQFVVMLAAALLGEYAMRRLIRVPVSLTNLCVSTAHWSVVGLAYLVPRCAMRSPRTRILASLLIISALAVARAWFARQLRFPVAMPGIIAPWPALFVFCVAAFLTASPRAPRVIGSLVFAAVAVQFLSMWWSYGFKQESLRLAALQVVPFLAATAALLLADNLGQLRSKHQETVNCKI